MVTHKRFYLIVFSILLLTLLFAQGATNASNFARGAGQRSSHPIDYQSEAWGLNQAGTPQPPYNRANPVELRLDSQIANPGSGSDPYGPLGPQASVELVLDDGKHNSTWGVNNLDNKAIQFIWLNRFTPDPSIYPFNLNDIWVLFDNSTGTRNFQIGDAIDLIVYSDTDSDPSNGATWQATINETIQVVDGITWSQYHLTSPITLYGPGDVLIAVINRFVTSGVSDPSYPASADASTNPGRSWWGWWTGAPPDPAVLPPDDYFGIKYGNWMIRGYGETTNGPPPSDTHTPTPTATVTQTPTQTQEMVKRAVNMPIVVKEFPPRPTDTPTPPEAEVYLDNDTGGELCYEVFNTGIGRRCFPPGEHLYGTFPAGTYSWEASARCGSDSGSKYYAAGKTTHRFWCIITRLQQDQK